MGIEELAEMLEKFEQRTDEFSRTRSNSNPTNLREMFANVDVNGDGQIDFEEFCAIMGAPIHKDSKDELKSAFDIFDVDGDGHIEHAEMTKIMQNLDESLTDANIEAMIKYADVNNDGFIDFEEFYTLMSAS